MMSRSSRTRAFQAAEKQVQTSCGTNELALLEDGKKDCVAEAERARQVLGGMCTSPGSAPLRKTPWSRWEPDT